MVIISILISGEPIMLVSMEARETDIVIVLPLHQRVGQTIFCAQSGLGSALYPRQKRKDFLVNLSY